MKIQIEHLNHSFIRTKYHTNSKMMMIMMTLPKLSNCRLETKKKLFESRFFPFRRNSVSSTLFWWIFTRDHAWIFFDVNATKQCHGLLQNDCKWHFWMTKDNQHPNGAHHTDMSWKFQHKSDFYNRTRTIYSFLIYFHCVAQDDINTHIPS